MRRRDAGIERAVRDKIVVAASSAGHAPDVVACRWRRYKSTGHCFAVFFRSHASSLSNAIALRSSRGNEKPDHLVLVGCQREPVDSQEGVGDREGSALVAVDERVVLRQALPEGGGFGDEVGVVAGLGPEQRGFQLARIADARAPAVPPDLVLVNRRHPSPTVG